MDADYWLGKSFWNESEDFFTRDVLQNLQHYTPRKVLDISTKNTQHSDMKDRTNLIEDYAEKGVFDSPRYNLKTDKKYNYEGTDFRYEHLTKLPGPFKETMFWAYTGRGDIEEFSRPPEKLGLFKGDLTTFQKVPEQCMGMSIETSGLMKILDIPSRLRVGYVKIKEDDVYSHHNELEYLDSASNDFILEDPTNYQKKQNKRTKGVGFKPIGRVGEVELKSKDFIYSPEVVEIVKRDSIELEKFRSPNGAKKGYAGVAKTLVEDLLCLSNEPTVPWWMKEYSYGNDIHFKVDENGSSLCTSYRGKEVDANDDENGMAILEEVSDGILSAIEHPTEDNIKYARKKVGYEIKPAFSEKLERINSLARGLTRKL